MICLPSKQEIAVRTMFDWTPPKGFANRLEMTHTSVIGLAVADALVSDIAESVTAFCMNCIQPDGGFNDSHYPQSEMECAYSAVRTLNLCGTLERLTKKDQVVQWILSKQHSDGAFGAIVGWGAMLDNQEELLRKRKQSTVSIFRFREDSSAHSSFFAYGALEVLGAIPKVDARKLGQFLLAAQRSDGSWGYHPDDPQGNTITTSFALTLLWKLGTLTTNSTEKTVEWLLACQRSDGSFAPFPEFIGTSLLQPLYTARASKALRILSAYQRMNAWTFDAYWNQFRIKTGWDAVCVGMAAGVPLVLRER